MSRRLVGTFLRALAVIVVVAATPGVGLAVLAAPASAAPMELGDWWTDTASWLVDGCNDVTSALLGSGAGAVAAGGTIMGGGLGLGRSATSASPNPYPPGSPLHRQTAAQTRALANRLASMGAPVATAPGAASTAGGLQVATGVGVQANGAAVATSSTAGSVTASATGGGATLSAGTVAVAAATFAGAFCGTTSFLSWASNGFQRATPPAWTASSEGLADCADVGGPVWATSPAYKCAIVEWTGSRNRLEFRHVQSDGGNSSASQIPTSPTTSSWYLGVDSSARSAVMPIACPPWDSVRCGLAPVVTVGGVSSASGALTSFGTSYAQVEVTWLDESQFWGRRMRLRHTVQCRNPDGMTTSTLVSLSAWFYESDEGLDASSDNHPTCAVGTAPVDVKVERALESVSPTRNQSLAWSEVLRWTAPSDVANNAAALQCLTVGSTGCAIHDPDPESTDPQRTVYVGGPSGVGRTKAATETKARDVLETAFAAEPQWQLEDLAAEEGEPAPPTEPGADECATPQCVQAPPAGDEGANCWQNGWSWNPLSWVYIPVKCALLWAFDPGDGFDDFKAHADAELGDWVALVGGLDDVLEPTTAAGVCVTIEEPICTHSIMEIEFGTPVATLFTVVWTAAAVWETIGFFVRMTEAT